MAVNVTHLNGDSTFLLSFGPTDADTTRPTGIGAFSVLVDPWLAEAGSSTIFHRRFALSKLCVPSCINSLADIPAPSAVVISQDRTDHCHEGTLKQLDPELSDTIIFAHPAAARRIRGWKYFNPSKVVAFPTYNEKKPDTIIRFRLPSGSPDLAAGEATLAFIPSKFDMTGTHNAVGITYRAPARPRSASIPSFEPITVTSPVNGSMRTQNMAPIYHCLPPTPPDSPTLTYNGAEPQRAPVLEPPPQPRGPLNKLRSRSHGALRAAAEAQCAHSPTSPIPPMPLLSPSLRGLSPTPAPKPFLPTSPTFSTSSTLTSGSRPRTISVLFAPHGAAYPGIRAYATSHLIQQAGLPLTLLLHPFDRVQNAWYLGGNIISGMPGGLEIARNLLAKTWISAHDEDKQSSGLAVVKTVVSKYTVDEVRRLLAAPALEVDTNYNARRPSSASNGSYPQAPLPQQQQAPAPRMKRPGFVDVRQMLCGEQAVLAA